MLRLRILKDDFTPLKKAPYELKIGAGAVLQGKTDDNGGLEHEIPNDAAVAVLTVKAKAADTDTAPPPPAKNPPEPAPLRGDVPITWNLKIGALNPIREEAPDKMCISGVQQRLNNLNMNTGPIDGILGANTKAAVKKPAPTPGWPSCCRKRSSRSIRRQRRTAAYATANASG
jgi:hypothetical protein